MSFMIGMQFRLRTGSSGQTLIDFAKQLLGQEKEMKRTMLSEKSQVRYSWELMPTVLSWVVRMPLSDMLLSMQEQGFQQLQAALICVLRWEKLRLVCLNLLGNPAELEMNTSKDIFHPS